MSQLNVVLFLDSRSLGGIESHVLQLAIALKHYQSNNSFPSVEVWFYQRYDSNHPLQADLAAQQIPYRYLQGSFRDCLQQLKHTTPTLLHCHGYKANIVGRFAAMLTGTAVVTTFHNGDTGSGLLRLYTKLDLLSSHLSQNIAVSEAIAQRLSSNVTVINNFVSLPTLDTVQSNKPKTIAFAGRLSHEKGPDHFVTLAGLCSNHQFIVYGDGPMLSQINTSIAKNIEFVGGVPSLAPHWQHIELLCITSRAEGLPMAALEAMANGVPVMSYAVGGLPKLIVPNHNGWLSEEATPEAMKRLIQHWFKLSTDKQQRIQQQCRKTIAEHYSPQAVLPQVLKIYQQAVQAKKQQWPLEE